MTEAAGNSEDTGLDSNTALRNGDLDAGLRNLLTRVEELEKRVYLIDTCLQPNLKSELVEPTLCERKGNDDERLGTLDLALTATKRSRVKYTQVTMSTSGKAEEKPGFEPTHPSPLNSVADVPEDYEVRYVWEKNKHKRTDICIIGKELKQLMWKAIEGFVEHTSASKNWKSDDPVTIKSSSPEVINHWEQLQFLAGSQSEPQAKSLKRLLNDMEALESDRIRKFRTLRDVRLVVYSSLHYLFTPGQYMVAFPFLGLPQLFQIDDRDHVEPNDHESFIVRAWAYDWNGTKLIRKRYKFLIGKFEDEKTITQLPFYPVEFFEDKSGQSGLPAIRRAIQARGRRFRELCTYRQGARNFAYNGPVISLSKSSEGERSLLFGLDVHFISSHLQDDIIIDPLSYSKYGYVEGYVGMKLLTDGSTPAFCKFCETGSRQKWIESFPKHTGILATGNAQPNASQHTFDDNEDHLLLLPARMLGFGLGTKCWAQFSVDFIREKESQVETSFENELVAPIGLDYKTIEKMIKYHSQIPWSSNNTSIKDPINGKGDGLILLFHGPTGVGKTLTAEILAKSSNLPLYKVGISDIGTQPQEAERGLRRLFDLAQSWNAILLIDEADVFLDSRGTLGEAELEKNALVAVLLREIEYFNGIVIMTTNRVLTFDTAMLSRIHWPINFGNIQPDAHLKIWNLWKEKWVKGNKDLVRSSRIINEERDVNHEIDLYQRWFDGLKRRGGGKDLVMNGREIRNIFIAARIMACGGLVTHQCIETCHDNTINFREEMKEVKLRSENLVAARSS